MTRRTNKLKGYWMPPTKVNHDLKEVLFFIPGGYPTTMGIPNWMRRFPEGYRGLTVRSEEYWDTIEDHSSLR